MVKKALIAMILLPMFVRASYGPFGHAGDRSFRASMNKSIYITLEPMFLKVDGDDLDRSPVESEVKVYISSGQQTREYWGLSSIVLPPPPPPNLPPIAGQISKMPSSFSKEFIIDRVDEFFPKPGDYQVQFEIFGIRSSIFSVQIIEPRSDTEVFAYRFLRQYKNPLSFDWVTNYEQVLHLREFLGRAKDTPYFELASVNLCKILYVRGDFRAAKQCADDLGVKEHPAISDQANSLLNSLGRIDINKASDREKFPDH